MTARDVSYEQVRVWVKGQLHQTHATVVQTIAWTVLCGCVSARPYFTA